MRTPFVFLTTVCLSAACHAQTCPTSGDGDTNRQLSALLNYIAARGGREIVAVAECAAETYRNASLLAFSSTNPNNKTEQLVQDVTAVQKRASVKLEEQGDLDGRDRFQRLEVALRTKVLEDLDSLPEGTKEALRYERIRQITYLIQSLERGGHGEAIHNFLTSADYDYFQPQVINAWLRSLYSCPDWKLAKVGNLTDAQLKEGVCQPACTPRARAALGNIEEWRAKRQTDWNRSTEVKELYRRLQGAVNKCDAPS